MPSKVHYTEMPKLLLHTRRARQECNLGHKHDMPLGGASETDAADAPDLQSLPICATCTATIVGKQGFDTNRVDLSVYIVHHDSINGGPKAYQRVRHDKAIFELHRRHRRPQFSCSRKKKNPSSMLCHFSRGRRQTIFVNNRVYGDANVVFCLVF